MIRKWLLGVLCALFFVGSASAQQVPNVFRLLTSYTVYATGTSTAEAVTIGGRLNLSLSAVGFAVLRMVSPLSFHFNVQGSNSAGFAATISSHFMPANEVGWFRVPWGTHIAVITPQGVLTSSGMRATIFITEME